MATYDTSRTIEVERSRRRTVFLVVFGVILGALQFVFMDGERAFSVTAIFGLFLCIAIFLRLYYASGPLTIGPQGIRDVNVSAEFIPWAAIESIKTETNPDTGRFLVLKIYPGWEGKLSLTKTADFDKWAAKSLGRDGLSIGVTDLAMSLDQLFECVSAYANAYRAQAHEPPNDATPLLVSEQDSSPPDRSSLLIRPLEVYIRHTSRVSLR